MLDLSSRAANQAGGGSHVGNCGYMVASAATGCGIARAMCAHSLAFPAGSRKLVAYATNG
ncbi:MAG: hypothetical protein RL685_4796 [Pseudomonadota bacterium]|jgi:hypothetical protein